MINRQRKFQSIAWAWAAGWVLVSIGQVISGVYNTPNSGLTAYYVLGFAGWAIGAASAIRYVVHRFGADVYIIALSLVGWGVGAMVAVGLMQFLAFLLRGSLSNRCTNQTLTDFVYDQ